jgi:hypothetical protein
MATVSKYEEIARSFLEDHPLGTIVTAPKLVRWVMDHADGVAIKPDLDIGDPAKRITTLRRHLNDGGRSDALPEMERFQLTIEDAKRKTFMVTSHADVVKAQADEAVSQTVRGALGPSRRGIRAIDSVKLDELPDIEREVFETARQNLVAMEAAIKPTMAQEVDRIWTLRLTAKGFTPEQARRIREALPDVRQLQKLIQITSR